MATRNKKLILTMSTDNKLFVRNLMHIYIYRNENIICITEYLYQFYNICSELGKCFKLLVN